MTSAGLRMSSSARTTAWFKKKKKKTSEENVQKQFHIIILCVITLSSSYLKCLLCEWRHYSDYGGGIWVKPHSQNHRDSLGQLITSFCPDGAFLHKTSCKQTDHPKRTFSPISCSGTFHLSASVWTSSCHLTGLLSSICSAGLCNIISLSFVTCLHHLCKRKESH